MIALQHAWDTKLLDSRILKYEHRMAGKCRCSSSTTQGVVVGTPIPSHIDLAGNTSYHFAASRTVFHGCRLTMARDRLRLLAHLYDSVASIHMTENPGRHG